MSDEETNEPTIKVTSFTIKLEEKVGLPKYSNVTYSAEVTAEPGEGQAIEDALKECEGVIEGWMKDYFRREVREMLQADDS